VLSKIQLSVIIPAYNPGKKIIPCLNALEKNLKFLSTQTDLTYEILLINDAGEKINLSFVKNIEKIKSLRLRKNKGVGYARQLGFKISKYDYLFYLDSDVVMENEDTIKILFDDFLSNKNCGSIGPVMKYNNLNDEFSSNFVAAKTCYGYEQNNSLIEFSGMRSECGLIEKKFLKLIGGWKFFPGAGGEEFELGHRITKNNKKNLITKNTNYSTFYDELYTRCKTIIARTITYLPIIISRKKFETKGAFATLNQSLSAFITALQFLVIILSYFINGFIYLMIILFILNLLVEFDFFRFAMKFYKKITLPLYIFGIYAVNISIIIGVLIGIYRLKFFLKGWFLIWKKK